jgi:hypothetical protein
MTKVVAVIWRPHSLPVLEKIRCLPQPLEVCRIGIPHAVPGLKAHIPHKASDVHQSAVTIGVPDGRLFPRLGDSVLEPREGAGKDFAPRTDRPLP